MTPVTFEAELNVETWVSSTPPSQFGRGAWLIPDTRGADDGAQSKETKGEETRQARAEQEDDDHEEDDGAKDHRPQGGAEEVDGS